MVTCDYQLLHLIQFFSASQNILYYLIFFLLMYFQGIRHVRNYPCCGDDPYPELIYHVVMYRRTAFYILVLIFPCILLSLLTLVMFWFPPQRPDRTGLGKSTG